MKESQWLLVKDSGEGFSTEEEAAEAGRHAKSAVVWCGAKMYMGVDAGDDRAHGVVTEVANNEVGEEIGIRLLKERHGLQVYEEDPELPTQFVNTTVEAKVGKSIANFEQYFLQAVDMGLELTERETLAFELYGLSHFESAERARFLTLVNAIESISENKTRSPEAVKHVEKLIELTRDSDLPDSEIKSMVGSLNWLRRESISKTGRDFVDRFLGGKEYGDKAAKQFFQHCYDVRSDLVHRGKPSDDTVDLRTLVGELDRLVADLLVVSAGRSDA